ncbi:hypothetical protein AC579_5109 [Pseudocercospora musae]|uniref:Pectate lyase n=1 Tax=Pseudocercospora musae TaxID=113226 RepID=A0A139INM7_9PEZI|nr:hypothetical protein AC579_5109 [Pseudocercospora musae]
MHFITMVIMLAAGCSAANSCTVGQTYCGKYLKNQGSGSLEVKIEQGWNNNEIRAALDNNPPKSIDLKSGGGIINNSVFLCKSAGGKNGGGGGGKGGNSNNKKLDWIAYCTSGCDSYSGNNGNDRCSG